MFFKDQGMQVSVGAIREFCKRGVEQAVCTRRGRLQPRAAGGKAFPPYDPLEQFSEQKDQLRMDGKVWADRRNIVAGGSAGANGEFLPNSVEDPLRYMQ